MTQLVRGIKRWDLVLLIINSVIGAGIFGLPSRVFNLSGTYSLIAFIVCAIAVIIFILCFAEVSSRFDKTGGPYLYTLSAFGPFPAYLTGWLLLLSRIFNYATLINLIVIYLSFFSSVFTTPVIRIIIIFFITALLSFINHVGVKNSARVSNIFTVAKIIPLTIFIVVGLFFLKPELLDFSTAPQVSSFSTSVLLLIFAFGGFESILINSGEISNPRKNLPFALFTGIAVITVFYILIQLVCIGTLPTLATSEKPLAEAAGLFMGQAGGYFIAAGALISIFGTLNALMLGGSRLPYALSLERQFPKGLDYVHPKYQTPTRSLVLFTLIVAVVSIVWGFLAALTIGAIVRVLVYFMVSASLIQLRRKHPEGDYFKINGGYVVAAIAIIICGWLLSASKLTEIRDVGICTGVGILVYILNKIIKPNTDSKN